jgi:hypothetical protein
LLAWVFTFPESLANVIGITVFRPPSHVYM